MPHATFQVLTFCERQQRRDTDLSLHSRAWPRLRAGRPTPRFPIHAHPAHRTAPAFASMAPHSLPPPTRHTWPFTAQVQDREGASPRPDACGAFGPPALFSASMRIPLPARQAGGGCPRAAAPHPWPPAFVACCSKLFPRRVLFSIASPCLSPPLLALYKRPMPPLPAAHPPPLLRTSPSDPRSTNEFLCGASLRCPRGGLSTYPPAGSASPRPAPLCSQPAKAAAP